MKQLILSIVTIFVCAATKANPGPAPAAGSAHAANTTTAFSNTGAVRFEFNKVVTSAAHTDSILVIFDRYDHTGAGVVYQICTADSAQGIDIADVSAGKYYVTIRFLGLHRDALETVITIRSKKNQKVRVSLHDVEAFSRDQVVIPAYRPDFADLAIRNK